MVWVCPLPARYQPCLVTACNQLAGTDCRRPWQLKARVSIPWPAVCARQQPVHFRATARCCSGSERAGPRRHRDSVAVSCCTRAALSLLLAPHPGCHAWGALVMVMRNGWVCNKSGTSCSLAAIWVVLGEGCAGPCFSTLCCPVTPHTLAGLPPFLSRRARKVLLALDLLQCSVQLGTCTKRWGLPQHARPRAAAIVASAVAAGVLSPAVEAAAPAPASTVTNKRGQQPSAVGAADEPAPSSSKRHKQEQQEGSPAPAATGDSLAPTVPLEGAAERSSASLPSVAPRSSPSSTVAGPSAATATAAAAAARTQSIAIGGAAALADAAPSRPAQPPQATAAAAPVATAAIAPSAPVGGTEANGGSGGGGGSGPAQLLPAPDELGELLTLPEGDVQLLPLAVQLLEVAEWAGVDLVQVGPLLVASTGGRCDTVCVLTRASVGWHGSLSAISAATMCDHSQSIGLPSRARLPSSPTSSLRSAPPSVGCTTDRCGLLLSSRCAVDCMFMGGQGSHAGPAHIRHRHQSILLERHHSGCCLPYPLPQDASKVRRLVAHALQPRPAGTAASSMWSGAGGER